MHGMLTAVICLLTNVKIRARVTTIFVDVYRFIMDVKDEDLHLQEAETDGYMFATLDEIKAFAAEDKFLH